MSLVYENTVYRLERDRFAEGSQIAYALGGGALLTADGRRLSEPQPEGTPKLFSQCPMLDNLYRISTLDLERCIVSPRMSFYAVNARNPMNRYDPWPVPDCDIFWAGYGFNTIAYTRDTAYSAYLGLCYQYPEVVRSHLGYVRGLRRELGWKMTENHDVPVEGAPIERLAMTERELFNRCNNNSFARRTDDVVWVLGAWAYYESNGREATLQWMADEFEYFDGHFYRYMRDPSDGLYRGQPSFIDVGGSGYPGYTVAQSVMLKALSTNCLYVAAFDRMAWVYDQLGEAKKAGACKDRAETLRAAIRTRFRGNDGQYRYVLGEDGVLSDRRETLGLAFLILFDIVDPQDFAAVLDGYPSGLYGAPCFWPFFEDNPKVYHNKSTWPFGDMLLTLAKWKTGRNKELLLETFARFSRHALRGNFNEVLNYATGDFIGGDGYIWSAAAYQALVFKMLLGMEIRGGAVSFAPCVPAELGGHIYASGIKLQGTEISVHITGNGNIPRKPSALTLDGGRHTIEIQLK